MAVRNVARGGGKAYKEPVKGLKELEKKLKALLPDNPQMRDELYGVISQVTEQVAGEMRAQARSAGWTGQEFHGPRGHATGAEAIASIFSFAKPRGENPRKRISGLAGISKQHTMVEWIAGKHPRSPRAKVAPGGKVAEAFATMLEIGTSVRPARPAIRVAVANAKGRVVDTLTQAYSALLQKYSK